MNLARLYSEQICPACGYKLGFIPWADNDPNEQVCPCCGIHFRCDDKMAEQRESVYTLWRRRWIAGGRRWWSPGAVPADFNPAWQLARLDNLASQPPESEDSN